LTTLLSPFNYTIMKTKYFMLGLCFALTPLFLMAQTTAGLNYQTVP